MCRASEPVPMLRAAWFIYIEFMNEKLTASENGASSVVETVSLREKSDVVYGGAA